jgi:hypothetical protein
MFSIRKKKKTASNIGFFQKNYWKITEKRTGGITENINHKENETAGNLVFLVVN